MLLTKPFAVRPTLTLDIYNASKFLLALKSYALRMSSSSSSSAISHSLQCLRAGSIHPPIEIIWASHPLWPTPLNYVPSSSGKLEISVLDSSFNPPTLAHHALANTHRPRNERSSDDYDAKLLLLSVRNADKELKPGDATYVQRVEMMIQLAEDLRDAPIRGSNSNIAVAIIDEPTFVGKSRLLRTFIEERVRSCEVHLTFLLGFDTLERLFAPKYYQSSGEQMFRALRGFFTPSSSLINDEAGDGSCVVCARRSPSSYPHSPLPMSNSKIDSSSLLAPEVNSLSQTISDFLDSSDLPPSCVSMIDIGEDVWNISSSTVRKCVKQDSGGMEVSERQSEESDIGSCQWREMVTKRVARYILEHCLYK